jgi:hypothetical protein
MSRGALTGNRDERTSFSIALGIEWYCREADMDTEPVVIANVQGEFEELALRTFLEANGISTVVRGEALRKTHAFVLDGLGAVEIMVAPEHAAAARDLIAKVESGELELASEFLPAEGDNG